MRKTKEEAQKTREQLMQSALDTFLEHGVARTSLAAIARNAGVTRGALYWHFKNKEDLFEALFEKIFLACRASLSDGLGEHDGQGLHRMLCGMFDRIRYDDTHRKLFTIIHLKCEFTEETRAVFDVKKKYIGLWEEQLRGLIRSCTERGELPQAIDPDLAVFYLHTVIDGLAGIWFCEPEADFSAFVQPVIDSAVYTLRHSPHLLRPSEKHPARHSLPATETAL
ncbi:Toluene efflux pump ttgABC operon repressor [Kingella potus]|uniref:Toluene efflux pump ttgABC operon repressor n=1 Tax=Kingella potus TaxID=265175 RepID=A0A377R2G0_9NEIS|nr:TetR family transcriptional regulator [Kingella potus]UOP00649.1 TetR family transcriptional regulator [Kingella potus]STR02957.1 Toluene efflux pump ttgABC operon repressor [Kingella potus]